MSTPLNMVEVVTKLGIKCSPSTDIDYDARLFEDSNQYCIVCNANQSFGRQQFAIARELGHLLLHSDVC